MKGRKSMGNNRIDFNYKSPCKINIDVYISNPYIVEATADSLNPFINANGTTNYSKYRDWELFVENAALKLIIIYNYKEKVYIDKEPHIIDPPSYYYWIHGRNDDETNDVDVLIQVKVADADLLKEQVINDEITVSKITIKCKELEIDRIYNSYSQALTAMYKSALIYNGTYMPEKPFD